MTTPAPAPSPVDGPIVGGVDAATAAQARRYLAAHNLGKLAVADQAAIVDSYWLLGAQYGIRADLAFAQACLETAHFTFPNQVPLGARNPAGIGAVNDDVSFLTFPSWPAGIAAHFCHLLSWAGDARGKAGDPRYPQVVAAAKEKGYAASWRALGGRWALHKTIPWPQQATMPGNYGAKIAGVLAAIVATVVPAAPAPPPVTKPLPAPTPQRDPAIGGPAVVVPIQQYPSPNFGYPRGQQGRNGRKVRAIVIHIMDGTIGSARSWFANPDSEASSNLGIPRVAAGPVEQYVGDDRSPWTNGDIQAPDLSIPWLRECITNGINPNEVTFTIECEGKPNEGWPEQQYQLLLTQVREAVARFGVPISRDTIVGHYRLNSVTRPNCPGKNFPWDRLFHDLGRGLDLDLAAKGIALKGAWALGRQSIAEAGLPDPYGLFLYEATADLSVILPSLPKAAQCLVCEKAVLWVGGAGHVDSFHRGQYEQLVADGHVQEWK